MVSPTHWQRELNFGWHGAVLELDLRLPGCRSLKEKRGRLAKLTTELSKRFPIVTCEAAAQNSHDRAGLAVAALASDQAVVTGTLHLVSEYIESYNDLELLYEQVISL